MIKVLAAALAALFLTGVAYAQDATPAKARIPEAKVISDIMAANPGATMERVTGPVALGFVAFEAAQHDQPLSADTVLVFRSNEAPSIAYVVLIKNGCFSASARVSNEEVQHGMGQGA